MLDAAGFTDLRNYIKRRVRYARYRVGSTFYKTYLTDVDILSDGTVRVLVNVNSGGNPITVNRAELYNSDALLWAHQDCNIKLTTGQTGALFWFDFKIREEERKDDH